MSMMAMCRDNPVMYYDPSGYTSTGTGGYEIGSLEEMKKRVQNWIRVTGIKEVLIQKKIL